MADKINHNSLKLTPEILEAAYHILLGRAPESPEVLSAGVSLHKDTVTLRKNFAHYPETRPRFVRALI